MFGQMTDEKTTDSQETERVLSAAFALNVFSAYGNAHGDLEKRLTRRTDKIGTL